MEITSPGYRYAQEITNFTSMFLIFLQVRTRLRVCTVRTYAEPMQLRRYSSAQPIFGPADIFQNLVGSLGASGGYADVAPTCADCRPSSLIQKYMLTMTQYKGTYTKSDNRDESFLRGGSLTAVRFAEILQDWT